MNIKQYTALVEKMNRWDYEYYVLNQSTISDREYDQYYQNILHFEENNPTLVSSHSPTQRVSGTMGEKFEKYTRVEKMYSLDNTYNEEDLMEFHNRIVKNIKDIPFEYIVEPKIDGLSIECIYENDELVLGATRGDGHVGEIVTQNIKTIRGIPLHLIQTSNVPKFSIRGEVYLERKDLELVNQDRTQQGLPLFKNPRNAASGSLRLLDSAQTAKRPLKVIFYDLLTQGINIERHEEVFTYFQQWGLPTHKKTYKAKSLNELLHICKDFEKDRFSFPFDIDGLVIKVNQKNLQKQLGFTSKYPKWAIAYKYETASKQTQVLDVQFQVGRTGVLTPVAHLKPVFLSGTTVSKASLHNIEEIQKKDLQVGDWVVIEKAGEIIPQVLSVVLSKRPKDAKKILIPKNCPECGSSVGKRSQDDVAIRCMNTLACPAQIKESIAYFCSRKAMNIEHMGPALVDQLVDQNKIQNVADIFTLDVETLASLDRMAVKSAQNVVTAIENAKKNAKLERLLIALGIPYIGETSAKLIAEHIGSLQYFLDHESQTVSKELLAIHGVGEKMALSIESYVEQNRPLISLLIQRGINPHFKKSKNTAVSGLTFCMTGKLSKGRDQVKAMIEDKGGVVSTSVHKSVNYLVTNENATSSKFKKAQLLGISVITEEELYKMLD